MGGGGGREQFKKKAKNAEKFLNSLWKKKKILDYFRSISCTYVSIHDCNCCKTGIVRSPGSDILLFLLLRLIAILIRFIELLYRFIELL